MEFDADGNFIQAGAARQATPWVENEHGIHVDRAGFVWIAGNGAKDSASSSSSRKDGKSVLQIGKLGQSERQQRHRHARPPGRHPRRRPPRARSSSPTATATAASSSSTRDRRLQAALGRLRQASRTTTRRRPTIRRGRRRSSSPTRCTASGCRSDGLVYVCDRTNNRIQVFQQGRHLRQRVVFGDRSTLRQRLGLGPGLLARRRPDASSTTSTARTISLRILQRSDGKRARQLRPLGPPGRPVPLGPQHRRRFARATSTRPRSTTESASRSSSPTERHSNQMFAARFRNGAVRRRARRRWPWRPE